MRKIMQINITCGRGSTGKIAASLYLKTQQEGFEARFAYSAYTPTLMEAYPIETKLQNYLRRGLNRFFGRKQTHSTPGTKRLIRYIKREKPDLIHLHNVQQNSVNYHLLFAFLKKEKIPVVYTLHDCWAFTGGCFHFTALGCNHYSVGCLECPIAVHPDDIFTKPSFAYRQKQILIGENDQVYPICVSEWLCSAAKSSYMGKMKHQPTVIYNGIDNETFSPKSDIRQEIGVDIGEFLILGVASFWTEEKGLSRFLRLAKRLPDNYKILLIGQMSQEIQENNVICLPQTKNSEELARIYSSADVYFNASIEETFGLTTAEALACGTPSIVFNSTACPEIIDDQTGIVLEREASDDELVDAVLTVKKNTKEYYTRACVERAKKMFDCLRMADEYMALYRRILDEKLSENKTK